MVGEQPLRIGILVSPTRTQETAQAACAALIALEHVSSGNGTVVRQFSQIRRSLNISGKVYDICGKDPYVCDLFGQGAAPETRLGSLQALEDAVGSKACDEQGAHDRGVHGLVGPVQAYSYEAIAMVAALHGIPLISPSESSLVLGAQGRAEGQQDSLDHSLGGLTIYNDQSPPRFSPLFYSRSVGSISPRWGTWSTCRTSPSPWSSRDGPRMNSDSTTGSSSNLERKTPQT